MWTDPGWFIYQLEVRIWFLSSASWPKNFLYLSFSTSYSSSLWRTDTIVFCELDKAPPPLNGLKISKPPGGLNGGFTLNYQWKLASQLMSLPLLPTQPLKGGANCLWRLNLCLFFIVSSQPKQEAVLAEVLMVKSDITYGEIAIQFSRLSSKNVLIGSVVAWENSLHFVMPPRVFPWNDVWEMSVEILSLWHVTSQIWFVPVVGWVKIFNQPTCHHYWISALIS